MCPCTTTNDSLKTFIDALGGSLDDADINSAVDTEGGKDLLAWLSQQAAFLDIDNKGPEEVKPSLGDRTRVILRDVTLEKDEIPFLTVDPEFVHDDKAPESLNSKTYMPPSKLKKQAAFINGENDLVQHQIDVLTLKISKTKEASKVLLQSIKSLQRVVRTLDAKIRSEEATITELSFNTDSTLATTISNAKEAFRALGYFPAKADGQPYTEDLSEANSDLTPARAFLLGTRDKISRITGDLRKALDSLSSLRTGQPEKIREIETESSRLQAAIRSLDIGEEGADVEVELRKICLLLEHEASKSSGMGPTSSELLTTLLSETDDVLSVNGWVEHCNLTVQEVLHHAWLRDQMVSLLTENAILDGACASLASVVEPLQSLRSSILPLVSSIREVEAVVEAFIEELAAITFLKADESNLSSDLEDADMEENLKRVLFENQGTRPAGALPLVLMTRDDILAELQEIRNRCRTVEPVERARTEDFIRQAAVRPLHTALPRIYVNSPLHASPPFAFPPDTQDLEACTRKKARELQAIADSVEEEFNSIFAKDNNIKRLDAFVEKWTKDQLLEFDQGPDSTSCRAIFSLVSSIISSIDAVEKDRELAQ